MHSKNIITFGILVIAVAALLGFLVWQNNDSSSSLPQTDLITNNQGSSDTPAGDGMDADKTSEDGSDKMENMENTDDTKTTSAGGPPEMTIDLTKQYSAIIKTSMGDLTVDLFEDDAPITVNNFVHLAETGFFDGLIFHRIIKDFMIQGGDPTGTGAGNPGYSFEDEFNSHKIVKGSLAMANSGPDSNGSQFFIVTTEATPWLDGKHTNFGQIRAGLDVIDAISKVETDSRDKPIDEITITSVEIIVE